MAEVRWCGGERTNLKQVGDEVVKNLWGCYYFWKARAVGRGKRQLHSLAYSRAILWYSFYMPCLGLHLLSPATQVSVCCLTHHYTHRFRVVIITSIDSLHESSFFILIPCHRSFLRLILRSSFLNRYANCRPQNES
jgi:hypothetical protein